VAEPAGSRLSRAARHCSRIAESRAFEVVIVVMIGANAVLLCV
jgi:voltage-gated sodium channel